MPGLPRGPRPPATLGLHTPRELELPSTRRRQTTEESKPYPQPPAGWNFGEGVWAIYWAHGPLKRGKEGIRWFFNTPLYGRIELSGLAPHFLEEDLKIAIDVRDPQHTQEELANASLRKLVLEHFGLVYIRIMTDDATANPIGTLRTALAGHTP